MIRCRENVTSFVFFPETYLGLNAVEIIYRIDDASAQRARWNISSTHQSAGLWNGGTAIPFLQQLLGKSRLVLRVQPDSGSLVTATFDLTGVDDAIQAVRDACRW